MNKYQAEMKVYAFHAVFRVDVNDVKPFQNPTETSVDSNFAFIDPVSADYYGGSGWLRVNQNDYVIDNYVDPAVI